MVQAALLDLTSTQVYSISPTIAVATRITTTVSRSGKPIMGDRMYARKYTMGATAKASM